MDKRNLIIMVLVLFLIGIGGVYAYNYVQEDSYQQGIQDAVLLMNKQILNNLQQNGYVPFVYVVGNQTQTINLIVAQQNQNE